MNSASNAGPLGVGPHATLRKLVNRAFGAAALVLMVTGGVSIWSNLLSEEAARQRRDSFLRSDAITHLLTAQAMMGYEEAALESGFDGYIAKPIDTRTFVPAVTELLEKSRGGT